MDRRRPGAVLWLLALGGLALSASALGGLEGGLINLCGLLLLAWSGIALGARHRHWLTAGRNPATGPELLMGGLCLGLLSTSLAVLLITGHRTLNPLSCVIVAGIGACSLISLSASHGRLQQTPLSGLGHLSVAAALGAQLLACFELARSQNQTSLEVVVALALACAGAFTAAAISAPGPEPRLALFGFAAIGLLGSLDLLVAGRDSLTQLLGAELVAAAFSPGLLGALYALTLPADLLQGREWRPVAVPLSMVGAHRAANPAPASLPAPRHFDLGEPLERQMPALGYRGWRVEAANRWQDGELEQVLLLRPLGARGDTTAVLGPEMQAACPFDCETAPNPDCECGLYSLHRMGGIQGFGAHLHPCHHCVVGAVAAFGELIEHEEGFRAEWVRVIALCDRGDTAHSDYLAAATAAQLGVPLLKPRALLAYAREHAQPLSKTAS